MNPQKRLDPLTERDREIERLRVENEKLKSSLGLLQPVADAAVAVEVAKNAGYRLYEISRAIFDAEALLADAEDEAYTAFNQAVTEYRALTEPLSPSTQAAIEKGLAKLEDERALEKIAYQQGGNASL
jgi:hypothetical protein